MKLGKYIITLEDTHDLTMQHKVKVTRTLLGDHHDVGP